MKPLLPTLLLLIAPHLLPASVAEEVDWGVRALPSPMAQDHLAELVGKGPIDDRLQALRLVGQAGRASARAVILRAASDGELRIAVEALSQLANLGPGALSEDLVLRQGLGRPEELVRRAAVHCLSSWGERRFVPDLAAMLAPATPELRTTIAEALTRITGERLGAEADPWQDWYAADAADAGARLEALRKRFNDPLQAVDEPTIASLASFRGRTSEAVELLLPLLAHQDAQVRAAVVRTLRVVRPLEVRELAPELQALTASPSASSGIVIMAPAAEPVSDGGLRGGLMVLGAAAGLMTLGWVWLGCTRSGRRVAKGTARLARRHGSRTAAFVRQVTGAFVVKLKGRRPPPPGAGGPFS